MEFKEKLKRMRIERELSQEALANRLHVSRQAIAKWESGNGMPDLDNLKAIADLFEVSLDALLREENMKKPSSKKESIAFGLAGASIGAILGLVIRGEFFTETLAGAMIGVIIAHLLFVVQHPQNQKYLSLSEVYHRWQSYWTTLDKTQLMILIISASIGGLIGLYLWNQGWI